jgi:hypothetical protein
MRCATCGHHELDHEGLSCRSREDGFGEPCECDGFVPAQAAEELTETGLQAAA